MDTARREWFQVSMGCDYITDIDVAWFCASEITGCSLMKRFRIYSWGFNILGLNRV